MRNVKWACAAAVTGLLAASAARAAVWDENLQGDLSDDRTRPSLLSLTVGANTVRATTGSGDLEYLRLDVPAGGAIQSLVLQEYASEDGAAFIGVQEGTTFSIDPDGATPSDLLGYALFGFYSNDVGTDLLPVIGTAPGTRGFSPPLTGSSYTLWIQQTGALTTYQLGLTVTPEPAGATLLAGAAGTALLRRRRRP